jgi:hypothetical protein
LLFRGPSQFVHRYHARPRNDKLVAAIAVCRDWTPNILLDWMIFCLLALMDIMPEMKLKPPRPMNTPVPVINH